MLAYLTHLVRARQDSGLRLDDILQLLVFVYSSADVRDNLAGEEEESTEIIGEQAGEEKEDPLSDFLLSQVYPKRLCPKKTESFQYLLSIHLSTQHLSKLWLYTRASGRVSQPMCPSCSSGPGEMGS